jgi:hypothetical protein
MDFGAKTVPMAVAEEVISIGKTVAIPTASGDSGCDGGGTLSIACRRETTSHRKELTIAISKSEAITLVQMERISFSISQKVSKHDTRNKKRALKIQGSFLCSIQIHCFV